MKQDNYLEKGEEEARKCKHYEDNCYCENGETCYVFGNKIRKAKNCKTFENKVLDR